MITLTFQGTSKDAIERDMLAYLGQAPATVDRQVFIHRETLLNSLVSELEFSVRVSNVLKNECIVTLKDLCGWSPKQLGTLPNMGRRSVKEVTEMLIYLGLRKKKG